MMSMMVMNMAAVSTATLLLLCCCVFASQGSQDSCDLYAETSKEFNVPLNHKLKNTERLKWKFNGNVIFDRDGSDFYDGKAGDVTAEGFLVLKKASKGNEGTYTPEVFVGGRAIQNLKSKRLCVIDPPPIPKVKVECLKSANKVKFTCDVGKAKNLKIEWQQNAKVLKNEENKTYLQQNPEKVENDEFRCNVSNPVSHTSSDPAKQNCYTSGFVFPEELWGINTWILVGTGGGVVILLIIIIIVCCVCNRRKKRMQIKDEEELRLGWSNTQQQQHPHQHNHPPHQHHHQQQHHHHHQQQPAGHTGPRQHRSRQQRNHPLPRIPDQPNGQPQPSPRRPAQAPTPAKNCDEEQPPPLPQPRKKAPKTPRA